MEALSKGYQDAEGRRDSEVAHILNRNLKTPVDTYDGLAVRSPKTGNSELVLKPKWIAVGI